MLSTTQAPPRPNTKPNARPTRRAITTRLFSFTTYLPDELSHYALNDREGEFCELPLYGVLRSSALPWCPDVFCALAHIHSPRTQVCCIHRVAQLTPREGAGSLPALLLDQGQLPPFLCKGGHTPYVRGIYLQALPAQGHVRVHGRRFGDLQVGTGHTPSREPLAPGRRDRQRAGRVRALGGGGHPLPDQDAAAALLRVRVEVHLGPSSRAAPVAFRWAGSERKLRGDRNAH